jgi:hypothetical protein
VWKDQNEICSFGNTLIKQESHEGDISDGGPNILKSPKNNSSHDLLSLLNTKLGLSHQESSYYHKLLVSNSVMSEGDLLLLKRDDLIELRVPIGIRNKILAYID